MKKYETGSVKTLGILIFLAGALMALYFGQKIFVGDQQSELADNTAQEPVAIGEIKTLDETAEQEPQTTQEQPVKTNALTADQTPTTAAPAPAGKLSEVHGVGNDHVLVGIPSQYTTKAEQVHKDVYDPLMQLIAAAKADGINLTVVSAYRSYKRQKQIWENKWGGTADNDTQKALDILKWSSFPGTSRHHWGTEIDFNSVALNYWNGKEGMRVHQWLVANAPNYGFCQTYGPNRTKGYSEEAWHWSHIPTAQHYFDQIRDPQTLALVTSQSVKGAAALRELGTVADYVTGISPCHPS